MWPRDQILVVSMFITSLFYFVLWAHYEYVGLSKVWGRFLNKWVWCRCVMKLLASFNPRGLKTGISLETQAKIMEEIKRIKTVMEVDNMKSMFNQYLFQEKQTNYLQQVKEDLTMTILQLQNKVEVGNGMVHSFVSFYWMFLVICHLYIYFGYINMK